MSKLNIKKPFTIAIFFFALAWIDTSFAISETKIETANTPIKIGVIYNLTGSQSALDVPALQGAKLAAEEINANGGIRQRPLKLIIIDGQSDNDKITAGAQILASDPTISAIIGLNDTDMAIAAFNPIIKNKKLFLTSGATSPKLPQLASGHICLACFVDSDQGAAAAEFTFEKLKAKKVYLLTQTDMAYADLISTYFTKRYTTLGGKIIAQDNFTSEKNTLSEQLTQMKNASVQPDVIYLAASPTLAPKIIQQLRANNFKQPIFGGDSLDSDAIINNKDSSFGIIYFTAHAFLDTANPDLQVGKFIKAYKKTYDQEPISSFAALGYDTVKLLAQAIYKAKTISAGDVQGALLNTKNFDGLTGTIMRFGNDCIPFKTVNIIRVQEGKLRLEQEWRVNYK